MLKAWKAGTIHAPDCRYGVRLRQEPQFKAGHGSSCGLGVVASGSGGGAAFWETGFRESGDSEKSLFPLRRQALAGPAHPVPESVVDSGKFGDQSRMANPLAACSNLLRARCLTMRGVGQPTAPAAPAELAQRLLAPPAPCHSSKSDGRSTTCQTAFGSAGPPPVSRALLIICPKGQLFSFRKSCLFRGQPADVEGPFGELRLRPSYAKHLL